MGPKELLEEALRLPADARAALAGESIESLEDEVDADAEAAWADEIRARPHGSRRRENHSLGSRQAAHPRGSASTAGAALSVLGANARVLQRTR